MKTKKYILLALFLAAQWLLNTAVVGQQDTAWTLQDCISYALKQNVQVRQTDLTIQQNQVNEALSRAQRFPMLDASVSQNFSWSKSLNQQMQYGSYGASNNTNVSLSSNVTLYNGGRISYNIRQSGLNTQAAQFDADAMRQTVSLNIMDAYLQVLYSEEQVKNSRNQVEATTSQLSLAEERLRLRSIAQSDYLTVKSQLAAEKQTLANAESQLAINRVTLMQFMDLPVNDTFRIAHPNIDALIRQNPNLNSDSIYMSALGYRPEIQSSKLMVQASELGVNIAKANYLPTLSMNAGLGTGYANSLSGLSFGDQFSNRITPSIGLSLSIPIYQRRQLKSNVELAQISVENSKLSDINTRNQLRKAIEQACVNVSSAEKQYDASLEGYKAAEESYAVAAEKFSQGMINSVDFLVQKTSLITAESTLLQSKYNLIFSYKTLDFYKGLPLTL